MTDVMCCQVGTMVDLAGYWPTTPIKDLFPDLAEDEEGLLIHSELKTFIYASKQTFLFTYLYGTLKLMMLLAFSNLVKYTFQKRF